MTPTIENGSFGKMHKIFSVRVQERVLYFKDERLQILEKLGMGVVSAGKIKRRLD